MIFYFYEILKFSDKRYFNKHIKQEDFEEHFFKNTSNLDK